MGRSFRFGEAFGLHKGSQRSVPNDTSYFLFFLGGGGWGAGEKIGKTRIQGLRLGLWGSGFLIRFFLLFYLLRSLFLVPCFVFLHISFFLSKIVIVSFVIFSGATCSTLFVLILLSSFMFTFHVLVPLVFFNNNIISWIILWLLIYFYSNNIKFQPFH